MIDHISFAVHDFEKSLNFYDNTLVHIGMSRLKRFSFNGTDMAGGLKLPFMNIQEKITYEFSRFIKKVSH